MIVMISLVIIVIIGYIAGKAGYMDEAFDKKLSALIVNITCPALIISSTMGDNLPSRDMILPLLLISTITYTALAIMAFVLPRFITKKPCEEGMIGFALMFGNVGFIGYPIVASIFGHEAVFYAAILNVPNTFYVFTIGTMLIAQPTPNPSLKGGEPHRRSILADIKNSLPFFAEQSGRAERREGKGARLLYSTPMLAAYLSIIIVACGITGIPEAISKPLTMIGNITVPGALLIIGSTMSQLSKRAMLGNKVVYATSFMRLVAIPAMFYIIFKMTAFSPLVVELNTVIIAMPVATYGTMLCLTYDKDTTLMTEVTFTTTILSMFTIPLLAQFFG